MSSVTLAPGAVSRPAINPWFVAAAVVVPTFMEVLDTTIANVALRYIAGGLSASNVDSEWVLTSYLAANATILPITRLAVGPPRPSQLLSPLDCRLHHCLRAVRHRHQPRTTDPVPGDPGSGRRRTPAFQPGNPPGQLPARETRRCPDDVRHRGPAGAGRRPDPGRLSHGHLQLALDLLHQSPCRRHRLPGELTSWLTTRTTSSKSGRSCTAAR